MKKLLYCHLAVLLLPLAALAGVATDFDFFLHVQLIRDLNRRLLNNWGPLSCEERNPMDLWIDEWNEHGTCSNMDQHPYFRAALEFKTRFNRTRILLKAGIVPSNENIYELSRIRDAVTEATGSAPSVQCNRNEQGEMQLYHVYQCVGLDGRSPVHCPRQFETRCTDEIKFPVFQINHDHYYG
ncbi:hypothetical protein EJB05_40696 [Eragrostis curvula]|uniref:Uncharacterized protein n=1 Tax=Eragrostis curvula TaxID=38414 RepID=A0A5J9TP83_9POAL|nr:hypothetical protein EJB05_40696 [Eragrostis curvula]